MDGYFFFLSIMVSAIPPILFVILLIWLITWSSKRKVSMNVKYYSELYKKRFVMILQLMLKLLLRDVFPSMIRHNISKF